MTRALLLLTLALLAPPALATPCPPIERSAGPPVYVILYGYPYGSPYAPPPDQGGLPDLRMVDDDLIAMGRFFRALDPVQMHVHGEPTPALIQAYSTFGVRAPTWRDLLWSVGEVIDAIDRDTTSAEPAEVYIYFSGHGRRTGGQAGRGGGRLAIYGRAEGEAGVGNGMMHSALFADQILAPLAGRARVHLIVDTCESYAMLQTRRMRLIKRVVRAPPREMLAEQFVVAFPHVGALLATRGGTYENASRGGVFSHAVRSVAVGPADLDEDGIITYAEMADALERTRSTSPWLNISTVVGPGDEADAPFIQWRKSPAARVCVPRRRSEASALWDGQSRFAIIEAGHEPLPLWLEAGHKFGMQPAGRTIWWFVALDGALHLGR